MNCTPKVGHKPTRGGAVFMTKFTNSGTVRGYKGVRQSMSVQKRKLL